ncbi:Gfo/Idh/MocA family protein [Microbispora sp. NPDC049125]|uniref:Gfo/Idh/MocA family protein n=1 Tax=Microbispora sp. NPDC049125 TaxID=3154929 RepID=UPI00346598A4
MTEPRTRVAVVGTGDWWGFHHARVFSSRDDAELCAIVGRTERRTADRAGRFGVRPYLDVEEMIDRERPDLISVCLPNEGHFATTLLLVRSGIPLLVEKPLVFSLDEADVLIAEAEARGLFFAINFNHRYARPVRLAADAIERGELGRVVFATWRFGGEAGTSLHPHANLIETQCHGFDMVEHLCGPIASVAAQMTGGPPYTTMAIAVRFVSGAVGTLLGTYDSSYAYPGTHLLEINGTGGRVLVEDTVRRYTYSSAGDEMSRVWQAGYFNDDDRGFHATFDRHVDEVLQALRSGGPPPVHARAGRRALALAHAVIRSFESGKRVDTVPDTPAYGRDGGPYAGPDGGDAVRDGGVADGGDAVRDGGAA